MLLDRTDLDSGWEVPLTPAAAGARKTCVLSPSVSRTTPEPAMRDFMAITKALADESRVRLLMALREREICVCQLIELVQLAPSTVSKHMSILKQARLVDSRKEGRWIYYRLADSKSSAAVRRAIRWVGESLADDEQLTADVRELERILQLDPSKLCEKQCAPKSGCGRPATRVGKLRR